MIHLHVMLAPLPLGCMGLWEAVLGLITQTSSAWSPTTQAQGWDCGLLHTLQFGDCTLWSNTTGPSVLRDPHTLDWTFFDLPLRFRLQRKEISRPFLTTSAPAGPLKHLPISWLDSHSLCCWVTKLYWALAVPWTAGRSGFPFLSPELAQIHVQ